MLPTPYSRRSKTEISKDERRNEGAPTLGRRQCSCGRAAPAQGRYSRPLRWGRPSLSTRLPGRRIRALSTPARPRRRLGATSARRSARRSAASTDTSSPTSWRPVPSPAADRPGGTALPGLRATGRRHRSRAQGRADGRHGLLHRVARRALPPGGASPLLGSAGRRGPRGWPPPALERQTGMPPDPVRHTSGAVRRTPDPTPISRLTLAATTPSSIALRRCRRPTGPCAAQLARSARPCRRCGQSPGSCP